MRSSSSKTILFTLLLLVNMVALIAPQVSAQGEGWLSGWDHRTGLTITGATGAGTDYQIFLNVTYDSEMQSDFDDFRFTDDDGITLLDYWIEEYTASDFAYVWVEVKDDLDTDQMIWMYWGNDGVSTTSNGNDTFIFFDDFEYNGFPNSTKWEQIGSENDITCNGHDLVCTGTGGTQEGYGGNWGSSIVGTTMRYRWNSTSGNTVGHDYGLFDIDNKGDTVNDTIYLYGNINANYSTLYTRNGATPASDAGFGPHSQTEDIVWAFNWYDDGTRKVDVYQNRTDLAWNDSGASIPDGDVELVPYFGNGVNTYYVHWVFVAKYEVAVTVHWVYWQEFDSIDFYFPVRWSVEIQFGYDAFFIFLGLIMIPVSTMYLVKGGRKEMSTDKLFFGLVIFAVGLGLLIGGIMP